MQFDKQQILSMISDPSQAEQAAQQLPDTVDHEEHSGLLQQFGVDPGQLGGSSGASGTGADQPGQSFQSGDPGSGTGGQAQMGEAGQGSSGDF